MRDEDLCDNVKQICTELHRRVQNLIHRIVSNRHVQLFPSTQNNIHDVFVPTQVLLMVSLNLGVVPAFAGVAAAAAIIPLQALMVRPVGALRRATALCTDQRVKLCSEAISVRTGTSYPHKCIVPLVKAW